MKQILSSLFLVLFISSSAQFSTLDILPTQGMWSIYKGYIDDMEIEVIPDGHRARVEMTFVVYVDSINNHPNNYYGKLPSYKDNLLEAQMKFKMPTDAFFYDSYLWLNSSTIIRSKLMPRGEANWVYDSIVNRKIDPSILQQEWDDNYSLKIFPISTTFARKAKIAFSVPFKVEENGREFVELPEEILKHLNSNSQTRIILNHKAQFKFKHLVFPLSGKIINETSSSVTMDVKNSNLLSNPKCYLEFQNERPKSLLSLFHQKLNADENFYDLRIFTKGLSNLTKPTSSFSVKIPLRDNGFIYQSYSNNSGQLNSNSSYIECGGIHGDIDFDKPIELRYKNGSIFFTHTDTMESSNLGEFVCQNWAYQFSHVFKNTETQAASLKYRVLNSQTAFLALENGDTVTTTKGNEMVDYNGKWRSGIINQENNSISIYPNPVVTDFTIESVLPIISIRILEISGRLIYSNVLSKNTNLIELNSEVLNMKRGIYWIIIEDKSQTTTLKIIKE